MPLRRHLLAAPFAWALTSCLVAPPAPSEVRVVEARVVDASGGVWRAEDAPRAPAVSLQLSPHDGRLTGRLFWITGAADEALLDDLADPPLRESSAARLLDVTLTEEDGRHLARLSAPLSPHAQSTLLVYTGGTESTQGAAYWQLPVFASPLPTAGARLARSLPADGADDVSTATDRALLHWDGFVTGLDEAPFTLDDGAGPVPLDVAPFDCEREWLPAGSCAYLSLPALQAGVRHRLRIPGLTDATGTPLSPAEIAFTPSPDSPAPALLAPPCALDESPSPIACMRATARELVVRTVSVRPALVTLEQAGIRTAALAAGGSSLELRIPVAGDGDAVLSAHDLAGRLVQHTLRASLESDLAELQLAEVLATPLGSDERSEYVEVVNVGDRDVELSGLHLARGPEDRGNAVALPLRLAAGARALLVGPSFDAAGFEDLPEGLPRATLAKDLRLPDAGGTLSLRDGAGRRVGELQMPATRPGQCGRFRLPHAPAAVGACTFEEWPAP